LTATIFFQYRLTDVIKVNLGLLICVFTLNGGWYKLTVLSDAHVHANLEIAH